MTVLDANAVLWLAKLTGGTSMSSDEQARLPVDARCELANLNERRAAKAERLYWTDLVATKLEGYESELTQLRTLEVVQRKKKRKVLSTSYDLEAWEVSEEATYVDGSEAVVRACEKTLDGWKVQIERATYPWTTIEHGELVTQPRPLFDKQQIGELLYSPLVRRVLFPDGLVPPEYSLIAQNISGSLDAYMGNEDLRYSSAEAAKEAAKVIGGLVKSLADVAGAGGGLADSMNSISESDLHTLQTVVLLTKSATDLVVTGVEVIPQGAKGVGTGLDKAFSIVGGSIASTMKIWDPTGEGLGSMVPTIVDASCKAAGRLSKGVADTLTADNTTAGAEAILEMIGEQLAIGFSVAGSASSDDSLKVLFSGLSTSSSKVVNAKLWTKLATAIRTGEGKAWADFATNLAGAVAEVVGGAVKTHMANELANKLDPDKNAAYQDDKVYKDWAEQVNASQWDAQTCRNNWDHYRADLLAGDGDSTASLMDAFSTQIEDISKAIVGDPAVQGAVSGLATTEASFEEREEAFEAELAGGGGSRAVRDAMMRIKRHEMVINMVTGVMKAGAAGVGLFFPAAQAAGTLADLIKTVDHLIADIAAVRKFQASKTWAKNANSHFVLPLRAFLDNEAHLIARDVSHMLLQFVIIGAKIASSVGEPITMASGKVADATASALDATVDVVAWAVDLKVARKAWRATEKALANPDNRRLALRAMRMNVTLGKYAIAYGATVQQDPVARQIVAKVGELTPQDLIVEGNKREALCEELFGLLQAKYDRMVQVKTRMLKENPPDPTWASGIKLSVHASTWADLKQAIESRGLEADLSPAVRVADQYRRDRISVRNDVNDLLDELLRHDQALADAERDLAPSAIRAQRKQLLSVKADVIEFRALCTQLEAGLAAADRNIGLACVRTRNTRGVELDDEVVAANKQAAKMISDMIMVVQEDAAISRDLSQDHEDLINRRLDYLLKSETDDIAKAFEDIDPNDLKNAVEKIRGMIDR